MCVCGAVSQYCCGTSKYYRSRKVDAGYMDFVCPHNTATLFLLWACLIKSTSSSLRGFAKVHSLPCWKFDVHVLSMEK